MKTKFPYDVIKNIDHSVKPGDDFWAFVNNAWNTQHPIPDSHSAWYTYHELRDKVQHELHDLLEKLTRTRALGSQFTKLKRYYQSGLDVKRLNREGARPLLPELTRIDAIHDLSSLVRTVAHLHTIGVGVLWYFLVGMDDKDSTKNILHMGQHGLGLPDRDHYLATDKRSKDTRAKYLRHMVRLTMLSGIARGEAVHAAKEVFAIEKRLAQASMTRVERRNIVAQYNKMTPKALKRLSPAIPWDEYFASHTIPFSLIPTMVITQPKFLQEVSAMFREIPLLQWKRYLRWHLIAESAPYLSENIVAERFSFAGKVLTGQKTIRPRWKRVISELDYSIGQILGKLYIEKHFPPQSKRAVNRLIDDLMVVYRERIRSLDWMGAATKKKALQKLAAIERKIGYPNKWETYNAMRIGNGSYIENHWEAERFSFNKLRRKLGKPVDRTEWHCPPQTVNAFYSPNLNGVMFPAGFLQPPMFDPKAPAAMNYGGVGTIIGHELTHGFDDQGRLFDKKGNLRAWWTKKDRKRFEKKAERLVRQYDACIVIDGMRCNGKLTLGENIADLGGVALAYHALKHAIKSGRVEGKSVHGFTPEQQLFMNYAHSEGGTMRPEAQRQQLMMDPHAPGKLRVNVILSNMDEFYEAFEVSPKDKLYRKPGDRVRIW